MSPETEKPPLPYWAWAAMGLCILIPILSLGGAIPGAIGGGGAAACWSMARNEKFSDTTKMGACAGIVVVCWIAFFAFGIAVALLTRTATP